MGGNQMARKLAKRNMQVGVRRSERADSEQARRGSRRSVTATAAKNQFGVILESARTSGPVFIEKHGQEQAVLLSIAAYNELIHKSKPTEEKALDGLREEFDALYSRMQTAASRKAIDRLLSASAEELNETARKRRG
jgi:prevent-host-death family protein